MTIAARYEDGVFKPLEDVKIEERTEETAGRRRSIKELPFYGMWADRTDIEDGVSYVDKSRR